jgi:hypothetical protein
MGASCIDACIELTLKVAWTIDRQGCRTYMFKDPEVLSCGSFLEAPSCKGC